MARACTETVILRVTPEEKRLLFEKAAKLGLTVSGFLVFEALGEELGQAILDSRKRRRARSDSGEDIREERLG